MPLYLINYIPNVRSKRYLELGTHAGHHFEGTSSVEKVGVDTQFNPTYKMTTDEFFATVAKEQQMEFDLVYIDADHTWSSVLRDFNNSLRHLSSTGIVFLHDMYPEDEARTDPLHCGNSYIILDALLRMNYPKCYTQESDCGLTMIVHPKVQIDVAFCEPNLSYQEFCHRTTKLKLYSPDEMREMLLQSPWRDDEV